MAEEKKSVPPDQNHRIAKLEQDLADAKRTVQFMQKMGGFADSKSLSMRSTRIEQRLEKLEFDGTLHKDVTSHLIEWLTAHLLVRHEIADTDNGPDMIFLRKIKRRLAEWADAIAKRPRSAI